MTPDGLPCVVGVDPGSAKAGFAVLDGKGTVVAKAIAPLDRLTESLRVAIAGRAVAAIALGRGTNAAAVRTALEPLGLPIELVDERETTRHARELYFAEHPPRGWRRLVPRGMLLPPGPIDDYAAVLIARRFVEGSRRFPR